MPYKFELFDYADVSLKHITERDAELLTELGTCTHESNEALYHANIVLLASKKRPGYDPECFFVGLGNDFTSVHKAKLIEAGFSEAFAELMWQLAKRRIYYVRLDDEGYEVDGVPLFD